jgi:hypothetical protein
MVRDVGRDVGRDVEFGVVGSTFTSLSFKLVTVGLRLGFTT